MTRTPNPARKKGRVIILILFAIAILVPVLLTLLGIAAPKTETGLLSIDGVRTISVYPGYLEKESLLYPVAIGWLATLALAFCPRKAKTSVIHSIAAMVIVTAVVVLVPLFFGDAGKWQHCYNYLLEDMNSQGTLKTTVEYLPLVNNLMAWIAAGLMVCANIITIVIYLVKPSACPAQEPAAVAEVAAEVAAEAPVAEVATAETAEETVVEATEQTFGESTEESITPAP